MTKEWNGQPISEMDIDHINNTIKVLELRAKTAYEKEALEVETTLDRYRAQAFEEKQWYDFLPDTYYHLITERDTRPINLGLNF